MNLLAGEIDIVIPALPSYWPWIAAVVVVVTLSVIWWLVVRAVRKNPNLHNHADEWLDT